MTGLDYKLNERKTVGNKVLPKAVLTQYYWTDRSNSTFVILLSRSAEIPRPWHYPEGRILS